MGRKVLSFELIKYIRTNLETIWALEILLLLCRRPDHVWSPDELNQELRGNIGLVLDVLQKFERNGLVQLDTDRRYRWAPANTELERVSKDLVAMYATHPLSVIKCITQAQTERLQKLADAFKINKDEQ